MEQARTQVFISYSHEDSRWLQRLEVHLSPLVRSGTIDLWDDSRIASGARWRDEIRKAVASAKVAILLVSADFLASDFINSEELPSLLHAAEAEGATVMPVIIGPSAYARTPRLAAFQAVNDLEKPLIGLSFARQEAVFAKLAEAVQQAVGRYELRADVRAMQEALHGQQQALSDQQSRLQSQQESINQLVRYLLSASIFRHLCGIALLREYRYQHSTPMSREMYFLRDIGFIRPRGGDGYLDFSDSFHQQNLCDLAEPTPIGWSCVRFRSDEIPKDWFDPERRNNLRLDRIAELGLQ